MEVIILGLEVLLEPTVLAYLLIGVVSGLIIGSLPGINENICFAIFLPFAFAMEAMHALALMIGIYCSAAVGGAIPAIMVKVPGTASALLTAVDGHAMARAGETGRALSIAVYSSVFGGIASALVLIFFAPPLSSLALRFGFVENFALCALGLASVVGLVSASVIKGLIAVVLGLLVAMIGFSPQTGFPRFTFDVVELYAGVPFIPLLIGLFGISATLDLIEGIVRDHRKKAAPTKLPQITGSLLLSASDARRLLPTWLKSATIGNIVGVLPGAGMLMAIYLAYDQAYRRFQKKFAGHSGEAEWGKGAPEGIASPECANNAVVASSMVPLLSLGIPGNSVSALFIGVFMIHGMAPGPLLFIQNADVAWAVILAFLVANIVMLPLALAVLRTLSRAVYSVPKELLVPAILLLCLTGSYSDGNSAFNMWVTLAAGFSGYALSKVGIPHAPLILALVLGPRLESTLGNSLSASGGDLFIFVDPVNHPISLALLTLAALFILLPMMRGISGRVRSRAPAAQALEGRDSRR